MNNLHNIAETKPDKYMKTYFIDKLQRLQKAINDVKERIIDNARNLDIKSIISGTESLSRLRQSQEEFSKDAVNNLSVDDVIELLNKGLISTRDAAYIYRYDKPVTLEERNALAKISYEFRDIKVK